LKKEGDRFLCRGERLFAPRALNVATIFEVGISYGVVQIKFICGDKEQGTERDLNTCTPLFQDGERWALLVIFCMLKLAFCSSAHPTGISCAGNYWPENQFPMPHALCPIFKTENQKDDVPFPIWNMARFRSDDLACL
jgi:hypothetical protein